MEKKISLLDIITKEEYGPIFHQDNKLYMNVEKVKLAIKDGIQQALNIAAEPHWEFEREEIKSIINNVE